MSDPSAYAVRVATDQRLLRRGCETLLGIASGLIADGDLNAKEVMFLSTWLVEHEEIASSWPGEVVHKRVREVLSDGVITPAECDYLKHTLAEMIGGSFADEGGIAGDATKLPIDWQAEVKIPNAAFCFTGTFMFGTRSACTSATVCRGGAIAGVNKKLDFLVIGELSTRDWKYSSFGTKIESAMRLRQAGAALQIVAESQWVSVL